MGQNIKFGSSKTVHLVGHNGDTMCGKFIPSNVRLTSSESNCKACLKLFIGSPTSFSPVAPEPSLQKIKDEIQEAWNEGDGLRGAPKRDSFGMFLDRAAKRVNEFYRPLLEASRAENERLKRDWAKDVVNLENDYAKLQAENARLREELDSAGKIAVKMVNETIKQEHEALESQLAAQKPVSVETVAKWLNYFDGGLRAVKNAPPEEVRSWVDQMWEIEEDHAGYLTRARLIVSEALASRLE